MIFNSYVFVLAFLPICLIGYYAFGHFSNMTLPKLWLLGCSLVCYAWTNPKLLLFLLASIAANYAVNYSMRRKPRYGRLLLTVGLLLNLGPLLYFKYTNFFLANINRVFQQDLVFLNLIMPLGISFFTFKQIGYLVDTYREPENVSYSLLDYALFVSFFPQLSSGPIAFHDEMIPQFNHSRNYEFQAESFGAGMTQFFYGLGKKVLLADVLAGFSDVCFAVREVPNSTLAVLGMFAYAMQIYFDFSGYSDMAIGVGRMMNFETVSNFNSPYKAVTIGDFWKRWHMSLTRFFTRYVYFPLGGNRKGAFRTYINVMIVFLLSGMWHGAKWTFIVWGGLHGVAQILDKLCKPLIQKIPNLIKGVVTFLYVCLTWIFFRADSVGRAVDYIKEIFAGTFVPIETSATESFLIPEIEWLLTALDHLEWQVYLPYIFIAGSLLICLFTENITELIDENRHKKIRIAVWASVLGVLSIMSFSTVTSFIYMNF